jgi:predicted adenylyl cyclase CyaB
MSIETELKAHAEKQDCKKHLETIAGQGVAFVKDDTYWFPGFSGPPGEGAGENPGGLPRSGLRVRREKKAGKETTFLTWKKKEKRDGMEINDEKEIVVSDGALVEELLRSLGLRKKTTKHKEGWVWNIDGVTAELAEVSGFIVDGGKTETPKNLGWFLELEIITEDGKTESEAKTRLLSLLERAGVDRSRIENRYYTELLAD